jgi:hypothetical protein
MASTTGSTTTTIIKSDRIDRSHYRPQYKAEVLAAYRESGMSGHAFAEQCGIKSTPFHPPSLRSKNGFKALPPKENFCDDNRSHFPESRQISLIRRGTERIN